MHEVIYFLKIAIESKKSHNFADFKNTLHTLYKAIVLKDLHNL